MMGERAGGRVLGGEEGGEEIGVVVGWKGGCGGELHRCWGM